MSKKRKTRKQKERAIVRHEEYALHHTVDAPTYSIKTAQEETPRIYSIYKKADHTSFQKDMAYLKHDITAITAASGIVVACEILLFIALTAGGLRLNFLGY